MRGRAFALLLLGLVACSPSERTETAAGCDRSATKAVTWSSETVPDVVTATSHGPSCAQAVVLFVLRNAEGDPLWTFASTHYDMTVGGRSDGTPVSNEQMDTFLADWADVTLNRSGELPEWPESAATLGEAVEGMAYYTEFDRETYEAIRARNLPQLCYAAAVEATQCLVIDPLSHAPTVIVAFGV